MQHYRLTSPIVSLDGAGKGMRIRQIASGEILDVPDTVEMSGLTEIVCQGQSMAVFIEDLTKKADRMEVTTPANTRFPDDANPFCVGQSSPRGNPALTARTLGSAGFAYGRKRQL